MSHSEITDKVLVYCNIVNKHYQQDSRILYTFIPNKLLDQLLDISPENFIFLKTFNPKTLYIEVWFTDQNYKPLEIEDKINITLVINESKKMHYSVQPGDRIFVKACGFLSFPKNMSKKLVKI